MTIKEQITALKSELAELKSDVEAGDESAIDRAKAIMDGELPELEERQRKSDESRALVAKIGHSVEEKGAEAGAGEQPRTIGAFCAKEFSNVRRPGERFSKSVEFKTDPTVISGPPTIYDYDKHPVNILKPLTIAELFGRETISGNALTFYVMSDKNGGVGTTSEGAKKNQIDFAYTPKTVALTKITGFMVETDEILEDSAWIASACQDRLLNKLALAEEAQLISGNGTAPNMTGILNTSGIGALTYTHGGTLGADDVFKAMMKVKQDSNLDADAIVINPADYQRLRLAKDSNNQYYGGGYFYGEYGNGGASGIPALWGLKTVLSTAVTAGVCIVGAFKQAASIVSKHGLQLDVTNTNGEDFVYNRVTIRAEKREALAVRVPAGFVKITEAAE